MYEEIIRSFVEDAIARKNEDNEFYVEKAYLIILYSMAKDTVYPLMSEVYDSGTVNFIPYVEVFEKIMIDDEDGTYIEFDVLYNGVKGIAAISAVIGNKFNDNIVTVLTLD